MLRKTTTFILSLLAASGALAAAAEVELAYRLQPSRDLLTVSSLHGVTTVRVVEDRGIIAKSGGRLSLLPATVVMRRQQSFRHVTGDLTPDGSFSADMRILEQRTVIQAADGSEKVLPERTALKGLSILAVIERNGSVRPDSVQLRGIDPSMSEQFRPVMQTVLAQAASLPSIRLNSDTPVLQSMEMQVPVPGFSAVQVKMTISNRLLAVDDGIARIEQVYTMDFGTAPSGTKMRADGSGGGSMLYDARSQTVLSTESSTVMKLTLETKEGVVEVQIDSKQTQETKPFPAAVR